MMNEKIYRGDIWLVDLDPVVGHEQAKRRPCIVISADTFNNGTTELAAIIPMTTKLKPYLFAIKAESFQTGLDKTSYILCHQMRFVSHDRFFGEAIGCIDSDVLKEVEKRLRILLCL